MKRNLGDRIISIVLSLNLVFNNLAPFVSLATVRAQDVTPEPTQEVTVSPTEESTQNLEVSPTETVSPSVEPTQDVTPTETVDSTPTVEVTPIEEVSPAIEPTLAPTEAESVPAPPSETSTTDEAVSPTPEMSVEPSPSPSPTIEPLLSPDIDGIVETEVVETYSCRADSLNGCLMTDKADYAPTEVVVINGHAFAPSTIYTIKISSSDEPAVTFEKEITTDEQGSFTYSYQLDGNYRPNYLIELKDLSGFVVASVTFTDTDTGVNSGSSFAGNISISSGDHNWSNANNIISSDNSRATVQITSSGNISNYLRATGFGFSIPSGATINGIVVSIERSEANTEDATIRDNSLRLVKNGAIVGDNKAATGTNWPTSEAAATYGATNDLWGTTWTDSDINNSNFGVVLSVGRTSGGDETARVDHITIKVTYSDAGPQPDLTATKTNDVGGNPTTNQAFTWTIRVENVGQATANFSNNQDLLWDERPSTGVSSYGSPNITTSGTTGTFDCSLSGTNNRDLVCEANGDASMPAGSYVDISYSVTPSSTGSLTNPRSGESCLADDDNVVSETNENNNSCSNTVNVAAVQPAANPTLPAACGLDLALVIDTSTSIDNTELETMRDAFIDFVNAFQGTPTQVAVVSFDDNASLQSGFTSDINSLSSEPGGIIDNVDGSGFTNWEDAIHDTRLLFPNRADKPDLIVFTSDGNPTVSNADSNTNTSQPNQHLAPAISEANLAKGSGIRIISLGIGEDVDAGRLQQISSADAYYSAATFEALGATIEELVTDLCGGTINITKLVDNVATSDWTFSPNVTGGTTDPISEETDTNGQVSFKIDPSNGTATVDVAETVKPGYTLSNVVCIKNNSPISPTFDSDSVNGLSVDANDIVACTFNNISNYTPVPICHATGNPNQWVQQTPATLGQLQGHVGITHQNGNDIIPPIPVFLPLGQNWDATGQAIYNNECVIPPATGSITITKNVVPDDSSVWDFTVTGAGGPYTHNDLGDGQSYTFDNLTAGSYNISEATNANYTTTVTCGGIGPLNQNGFLGTVVAGQDLACTFTNTRNTGSIKVNKLVDTNANGTFETVNPVEFNWSLDGNGTNAMGSTVSGVNTGLHNINENSVSGYHLVGWYPTGSTQMSCANIPEATIYETLPASVSVSKDTTTDITICNARDSGLLQVNKLTDTDGDGEFETGYDTSNTLGFRWGIGAETPIRLMGPTGKASLLTGDFNITENNVTGYHYVGWSYGNEDNACDSLDGVGLPTGISVTKDSTTYVTLCNATDTGSLRVLKNVDLNGDGDYSDTNETNNNTWKWQYNGSADQNTGASAITVPTGDYALTETMKDDFHYVDLTCTGGTLTGNSVNVGKGANVVCTFKNARDTGTITIIKDAINNDGQDFSFDTNMPNLGGDFDLEDDGDNNDGQKNFITRTVLTGSYWVREDGESGWKMTDLTCTGDGSYLINKDNKKVDLTLEKDENVTCTFTNTELGKIKGFKFNDKNENEEWNLLNGEFGLGNWRIFIDENSNQAYDNGELTDNTSNSILSRGYFEFENLLPGTYIVCEELQNGWINSTPICYEVNVTPGSTDELFFGNHEPLTIRAYKIVCENESDLPNWGDNDAPNINNSTAQNYVNSHPNCHLESGWDFQYGLNGQVSKESGEFIGPAGGNWRTLGTTNGSGYAEITLNKLSGADGVWVRENLQENYVPFSYPPSGPTENDYSAELYCHRDGDHYDNFDQIENINFGSTYYCVAFNAQNTGDIIVTKYNDRNNNETRDDGEETLPGWDMTVQSYKDDIFDKTQTTEEDGTTTFNDVTVGQYILNETLKEGWIQTELRCDDQREETLLQQISEIDFIQEKGVFDLDPNETQHCIVGNHLVDPILQISKSNDALGDKGVGDSVIYTITLKALDSKLLSVVLKDILPQGFNFQNVISIIKNGTDDITAFVGDPNYASPGTYNLGDMEINDEIVVKYSAKIDGGVKPGLYKDLAWATGKDILDNRVLALSQPEGYVNENFVGTEVSLASNYAESGKIEFGQVLGASTSLPATGGNAIWIILASILSVSGLIFMALGLILRKKNLNLNLFGKTIFGLILALALLFYPVKTEAAAGDLTIRLAQPKTPTANNNFDLVFTVLDLNDPASGITVKCYKKGPSDGGYSQFGSDIAVSSGGNSGKCADATSFVNNEGTYLFYATAFNGADSATSESEGIVAVDYNTQDRPGTPTEYKKEQIDTCKYKISFKTADDGVTSRVELYRSDKSSFSLDGGTRVAEMNIGPNQSAYFEQTLPDCEKTYYFIIRAFNTSGNASGAVGDSGSTVITSTTTESAGAIPVEGANLGGGAGTGGGEVLGEEEEATEEGEPEVIDTMDKGLVKGASDFVKNNKWPLIILGLIVVGLIVYVYNKRKRQTSI